MAIPQTKLREILFLLIYSQDFAENDEEGIVVQVMTQLKVSKKAVYTAFAKLGQIQKVLSKLDPQIQEIVDDYSFNRITRVELNALRLGLFEIQYDHLPLEIAMSEAIRITRKFGSPEGASFVNGVLDALCKQTSC